MAGMFKVARGGQRRRSHGFSEINVTPLVDVMLVLLVVFMISAPMLTVGVPLDLPKTKAAQLNDQVDPIVISIDPDGRSFLQETELSGDALIERLRVVTQSNPEAKIYVRGHTNLAYGRVMEVMGEISASGFTKVSLLAEMPTGPKTQPVVGPKAKVMPVAASSPATSGAPQGLPTLQNLMPPQGNPPVKAQGKPPVAAPVVTRPVAATTMPNPGKATPAVAVRPTSPPAASTRAITPQGPTQPNRSINVQRPPAAPANKGPAIQANQR